MERDEQLGGVSVAKATAWAKDNNSSVKRGIEVLEAAVKAERSRRSGDPFNCGYEPPIWFVASALLRGSPVTDGMRREVQARCGMDWEAFQMAMCHACGFERPVDELLIMGANRSGKTDWASKRLVRILLEKPELLAVVGAQTRETSRRTQQDRVWHYLTNDLKKRNGTRESVFYLNYKMQTGFTFNKVTLDNKSSVSFTSYEQNVNSIMEGPAFDEGWLDEEFPESWMNALKFRLASKRGRFLGTFTPVSGYTPVVADWLEGMTVTRRTTAYLLPKDGLPPMPGAQLGLSEEEYWELSAFHAGERSETCVPESRPENCFKWIGTEPFGEPENVAEGRVFETMPRVARTRSGTGAILWFLGRDNPYGSPARVLERAMQNLKAGDMIRQRVYGMAKKTKAVRFPSFNPKVHVVAPEAVPQLMARTMVCDPAPERNWFFLWMGVDVKGDVYVYREWPGDYEVPGIGVPGAWAERSSRRNGINDGERGPAQEKFGFSLEKYKAEWARLEGWKDAEGWIASGCEEAPRSQEIAEWSAVNGTMEPLRRRVIDARASSQSKITMGEDKTLFDFCMELCDDFVQASGRRIGAGEELINGLLNPVKDGRRLFISSACKNTIFALQNITGVDGQKGACKEPIDCLRYGLESGMLDDEPSEEEDGSTHHSGLASATKEDLMDWDWED